MRRDPTAFRERFKKWKETGEYELPRFEDGYESFLKTLPKNQKTPGAYNTRRYWELNGKPKDFAEAIGKGMYAIQNDNGALGWHANSVAYNESNDTYEFMKPNYHPTRWMELVYGYDKDSEFLKDWKVLYNGPMLSDKYVRREKPGLKVKGGQLPKFYLGTEGDVLYGGELPEIVVVGNNYIKRAQLERSRYRSIAKSYLKSAPSVNNIYNAISAVWKSLPFVTTASSINPYINKGDAPSPGMRNPKEIVKSTKNIGQLFRTDARTLKENDLDFAAQYNRLKSFLTSDGYKKRLIKYYRDKGSSIVTQNHAPEARIGELLYNIETAHPTIKPRGKLVDSDGSFISETTNGVYHPEEHTILVADDAINTSVPRHEMIHARSRGQLYLDNEKYKMRTKYDKDFGPFEPAPEEGLVSYLLKRHYYGDVVELEPRVLNTLDAMQREGYDINNLSDEQIYKFLYDRPIDSHILDTQSLIDNYMAEDIPTALRNFKNIVLPLGLGGIGYKYIKNTQNELRNK